jgi:hypothetical protein
MYYALFDENKKFIKWINLQLDYPNISFPTPINHDDLPEGVYGVMYGQYPTNVEWDENVEIGEIPEFKDGDNIAILNYRILKMDENEREIVFQSICNRERNRRNDLLTQTDYLLLEDIDLSEEKKQSILLYRKKLRDIPSQGGFPLNIIWPNKP